MISILLRLFPASLHGKILTYKMVVIPLFVLVLSYLLGLIFMYPLESEVFKSIGDYTWYFFVTATTVGYGDYAPKTDLGRMFAILFNFIGPIGAFGALVTYLLTVSIEAKNAALRGTKSFIEMINHTIILGFGPDTSKLIAGILSDTNAGDIVLVCNDIEHPLPSIAARVKFVRGIITDTDTLLKAGIQGAKRVVIHGMSDEQTLMATLAVRASNTNCHIVAEVDNEANLQHFARIQGRPIECATNLQTSIAALAVYDPGITSTLNDLIADGGDANLYILQIPPNAALTYNQIAAALEKQGAKVLGFELNGKTCLLPNSMTATASMRNARISYIAKRRLRI